MQGYLLPSTAPGPWPSAHVALYVTCSEFCVKRVHERLPVPQRQTARQCVQGSYQTEIFQSHQMHQGHSASLFVPLYPATFLDVSWLPT